MPKKRDPFNVEVGQRLERLRKSKGFHKIRPWAALLEIHEDTWRAWEKGDNRLPYEIAVMLETRFHVPEAWIYRGITKDLTLEVHAQLMSVKI